jgi:fatty acid desaturase
MMYVPKQLTAAISPLLSSAIESCDPRDQMAARLPCYVQPFLSWLTAKPAKGEPITERAGTYFVQVALLQLLFGVAIGDGALHLPLWWSFPLLLVGLLLTSSGLGLFQVVVFHHCAHGTVFRTRERNILIGQLVSALLIFKHFDIYKREHMMHHSPYKLLTEEDEFAQFVLGMCGLKAGTPKRRLWRRVLLQLVSPGFHLRFLARRAKAAWWSHDHAHNAIGIGCWIALTSFAVMTGQFTAFLVAWVLPVTVLLQIATVFRILCEHSFPSEEIIHTRASDFTCHASLGVFSGVMPPSVSATTLHGCTAWVGWWAQMLTVQLFVRVFVLVGDAPCHDWHHHRPASRLWTSYIQARQRDVDAGSAKCIEGFHDVWGLFRAIDQTLAGLARTPQALLR